MRPTNGKPPRERHRGGGGTRDVSGAQSLSSASKHNTSTLDLDDLADRILARVYQRLDDLRLICHLLRRTSYPESARIARACVQGALDVAAEFERAHDVFERLARELEEARR